MRFDVPVLPGGYAWWYVDAVSDDGGQALTVIAFIGSVFSPYYAWSGRRDPYNHCALNVALYRPNTNRWAMTERGRALAEIGKRDFSLGRSRLEWRKGALTIDIDETGAPIPKPIRGRIVLRPHALATRSYFIDRQGRHQWRPIAPSADVEAHFSDPALSWRGRGYLDCNAGDEPLEEAFRFWDWSRTPLERNSSAIIYNVDPIGAPAKSIALRVDGNGETSPLQDLRTCRLPRTPIWRIERRTAADGPGRASIIKTLEDTPFYSRSLIETELLGEKRLSVHETFAGPRLKLAPVKAMLTVRMPRRIR